MIPQLRDYQIASTQAVKKSIKNGHNAPTLVVPTGGGKTVVAGHLAAEIVRNGNKVLFLTHRGEIAKQTLKKFYDFGMIAGQIISGKPMTRNQVQVGMVQTVVNRLSVIKKPDFIICDEYHHFVSPQFQKVIAYFGDVPRLGLTATPERMDGVGLETISDDLIIPELNGERITTAWLVKKGYLSYPRLFKPEHETEGSFKITRGDFDKGQQEEHFKRHRKVIYGDVIEHYRKYLNGNPAACFCISHAHMEETAQIFKDANIRAVKVFSGMPDSDRDRALKGIADGTFNVILSVDILGEGVDVPGLFGVIMLRKTASLGLYLQQAGRALRLAPELGKTCAFILDHCGNYKIHGHVLADRDWSLYHGKRNVKKDKVPTTTECPKCRAIWPGEPVRCPECGFEFSKNEEVGKQQRKGIEIIAGELKEILPEGFEGTNDLIQFATRIQSADDKTRQKAAIAMAFKMRDADAIKAMGKVLGYKPGWSKWTWDYIQKNGGRKDA